jgi:hypothetical protein
VAEPAAHLGSLAQPNCGKQGDSLAAETRIPTKLTSHSSSCVQKQQNLRNGVLANA